MYMCPYNYVIVPPAIRGELPGWDRLFLILMY